MKAYYAFHEKLLSAFGVACFIVLALVAAALHLSKDATEAMIWVQHTYEVLNSVVEAKSDTIQIELSTQSYRITGDEQRLAERDAAIQSREKSLKHIQEATRDNPHQQHRWQQLRKVIDVRLAISKQVIYLRKHQGVDAANAYIATTPLQETRKHIYQLWRDMENEERQLLKQRQLKQQYTRQLSITAVLVAGGLLIALLISTFLLVRKQLQDIYMSRKQLAENENNLSITLQSIGDGVMATDTEGRITRMNPVAESLTGWPFKAAQGRAIAEVFNIINESTGQPANIPIQQAIDTKTAQSLEKNTILVARNGNKRPIADSAAPILDISDQVIGLVLVFRDVSLEREAERRIQAQKNQLEKEVEARTAELQASAKNLLKVTDNVPALIAYVDAQKRYVYANQRYIDRFSPGTTNIKGLEVSTALGKERYNVASPYIDKALSGKPASYDWEPFPDVWQMVNYIPTTNADGVTDGYYVLIADITDRKLAELAFYKLTHFDALTGLPNEAHFTDLLLDAIETGRRLRQPFPLIQINIEKLSEINDALGFSKGDQVLKEFAERLKLVAPASSHLARLRGDEFAILLTNCNANEAIALVSELEHLLAKPIVISDIALDISAKIGIALFPEHGLTPHDLYRHTDFAVRQAKKKGVRYQMFDHTQDSDKPHRLAMAAELRRGIDQNHLELYLQPKIEFKSGKICGAEALVRWHLPGRGLVSPNEFIPLAEQIGLIKPLTQWVIDTTMQLIHDWHNNGFIMPIAVNLSARNLHEEDLIERVRDLKSKWSIGENLFEIEVTESSVMDDAQHALEVLYLLREQGIPLSIDDFGTGYSSLSYLQRLPMQFIKIDQSFVSNMLLSKESLMIVRSTIELAHALDKKVVAEGVETQEQWDRLSELGCDIAQGYWIARPMPINAFLDWIKNRHIPAENN